MLNNYKKQYFELGLFLEKLFLNFIYLIYNYDCKEYYKKIKN